MNYNSYMVERMALEMRHDRMVEAVNHNRWIKIRQALREIARCR